MTPKGTASDSSTKIKKLRAVDWPPPPLVFPLPPQPDDASVAQYSAAANDFYGDFRVAIHHMLSELTASQVNGSLIMKVVEAHPRGMMPEKLWDEVRPKFEEKLRDLLLGHSIAAEIPLVKVKSGYCWLKLWLVPDVHLALGGELGHTSPRVEEIDRKIGSLLEELTGDARQRLNAVGVMYAKLRKQVAAALAPTVTALLQNAGSLSFDEKNQLSHEINDALSDARLSIRDPETGRSAKLEVSRPRPTGASYLRLKESRTADGRRNRVRVDRMGLESTAVELVETPKDEDRGRAL